MYVPEDIYMPLAVPGVLALSIGVLLLQTRKWRSKRVAIVERAGEVVRSFRILPFYLVGVGIICSLLRTRAPGALGFVFYVMSNVLYIGVLYGIHAYPKHMWHWAIGGLLVAAAASLQRAMFHDMLLWTAMIGIYLGVKLRPSMKTKLATLAAFAGVMLFIQATKMQYREYVWGTGYSGSRIMLLFRIASGDTGSDDDIPIGTGLIDSTVIRINQGWIISRIMQMVPAYVPRADGETVRDAVFATLVPRFLYPNKPKAGGRENYERFTGYPLERASMGISLLGEGYANFGVLGAPLFLLAVGLIYSVAFRFVFWIGEKEPTLILWLPLLFLHVVKAESELVVVLNYLVKAGVLIAAFLIGSRMILGKRV
jgi:hypothetical protein